MAKKKTSMDTARETAGNRLRVVQSVAAHSPLSVQTTGNVLGTGKVATAPPDTGKGRAGAAARRKYRQTVLGIDDLREATADELAHAHEDPHALLTHDDIVAARDQLAYSQAHGGTNQLPAGQVKVTPGKPGGPTSLGGRPVVTGAGPSAPQVLSPVRMRKPKRIAA